MKFVFHLLMIILFVLMGGLFFFIFIKQLGIYSNFKNYLLSINDKDTLNKIKILNPLGQRCSIFPFSETHKVLLEKDKTTNDDKYLLFDKQYIRCIKQMAILAILLSFLFKNHSIQMASN